MSTLSAPDGGIDTFTISGQPVQGGQQPTYLLDSLLPSQDRPETGGLLIFVTTGLFA